MNCPDCGNEMVYDGWGVDLITKERHNWWLCEECGKMEVEVVKPCYHR